jgi:hypothetical protein
LNSFWKNEVIEAYDECEKQADALSYWTQKMRTALERWDGMIGKSYMPTINLSVRLRSEGSELAVEVYHVRESHDKLLLFAPAVSREVTAPNQLRVVEKPAI